MEHCDGNIYQILLIEDDENVRNLLKSVLDKEKLFKVFEARSLYEAKKILLKRQMDIVSIDLELPDGYGLDILPYIEDFYTTSLIVLSKQFAIRYKEEAFVKGVADFIAKPFLPEEFVLRCKKLLNVFPTKKAHIIKFKSLSINIKTKNILYKNAEISLTHKEFLVMSMLMKNRNYCSKQSLVNKIREISERNFDVSALAVLISRLRKKMKNHFGTDIIQNKYAVGYRLVVD